MHVRRLRKGSGDVSHTSIVSELRQFVYLVESSAGRRAELIYSNKVAIHSLYYNESQSRFFSSVYRDCGS